MNRIRDSLDIAPHLDTIIQWGLILLLVWTPFAFSAVHAWASALMAIHIFVLLAAWMLRLMCRRWLSPGAPHATVRLTPLALPLGLFALLLILQLIPLSSSLLTTLSASTAELYRLFLPDWPHTHATLSLHPYATRLALTQWLAYAGLYILVVNTLRTRASLRLVYRTIMGVAIGVALLGLAQELSGTSAIYWVRDTSYVHFFGPFINSNHAATYLGMAILLGFGLLCTSLPHRAHQASQPWGRRQLCRLERMTGHCMFLIYALTLMAGALCLSLSRAGILSLLGGILLFGLLHRRRHAAAPWLAGTSALAGMAMMMLWLGGAPMLQRFAAMTAGTQALTWAGRLPIFRGTWDMAWDFPLFGVGYAAFPVIFPHYQPAAIQSRVLQAHNDVLQLLAETGWVGCLTLGWGFLWVITDIVKRWHPRRDPFVQNMASAGLAALLAMTLHALVDFPFHVPANALLFTVVLGLTYACVRLPRAEPTEQQEASRDRRRWHGSGVVPLSWVIAGVALWLSYEGLQVAVADLLYPQQPVLRPSHWVYHHEAEKRYQRLQQALRWTPQNDRYWGFWRTWRPAPHGRSWRQAASRNMRCLSLSIGCNKPRLSINARCASVPSRPIGRSAG